MIKHLSINSRIIIGAITLVGCFMIVTAYSLGKTYQKNTYATLEERLTGQIYLLMADRELNPAQLQKFPQALSVNIIQIMDEKLSAFITQDNGDILWQSQNNEVHLAPTNIKLEHGKKQFKYYKDNQKNYISLSIVIFWDFKNKQFPLIYHINDDLTRINQQISTYKYDLWIQIILMSIILLVSLFMLLRWGLKPLREVEQEIKAVEQGEQNLLEKIYPKELTPLTRNINQLIQFERQQQLRYQNALGDLAHSLKTPLAIIKNQNLDRKNPNDYIDNINNTIQKMNSIVEYQLQRAATTHPSSHIQYLKLSPICTSLINSMKKIYHTKSISFVADISENLQFKIDEGDFMELIGNLLDNASKWCHSTVSLSISNSQQQLSIQISDDGPGIQSKIINEISQRGFRADQITPGHGIGLSIVKDIVNSYKGTIEFSSSENTGLKVDIQFKQ